MIAASLENDSRSVDFINHFLREDSSSKQAFINFLKKSGYWSDVLGTEQKDDNSEGYAEEKFGDYLVPENISLASIESRLSKSKNLFSSETDEINSCMSILFAGLIPIFLKSVEYEQWLKCRTADTVVEKPFVTTEGKGKTTPNETREMRLQNLLSNHGDYCLHKLLVAFTSTDTKELSQILAHEEWFNAFAQQVEDLPICVSLATARQDRRGFPLIYVNKEFERITQFQRSDIVGQNCRFLQSTKSEPQQIQRMVDALANARPVKIVLTNKRKDGSEFQNLLAMKPVFDGAGSYTYVVGVQIDVSDPRATKEQVQLVSDLLALLPNTLS